MSKVEKSVLGRVEIVETILRTYPKSPKLVFIKCPDAVVTETVRICRIIIIMNEGCVGRIESVETPRVGTNPNSSLLVL
jgi:hypothetical protein